jgi:AcrR family transcriptional regulator
MLTATTQLLERDGLAGVSAREVARRIGYSAGTLYNVFKDLDDLIIEVESRLLDRLTLRITSVPLTDDPVENVCQIAAAYLAFTQECPKLWNLLFEHHMPPDWPVPTCYQAKLEAPLRHLETCLVPILAGHQPERTVQAARVLWSGIHGITCLASADKLPTVTGDTAALLVDDFVRTYLAGLMHSKSAPKPTPGPT